MPLTPVGAPPDARGIRRELLLTWAEAIGLLAVAKGLSAIDPTGILKANLAGVAALLFLGLADRRVRRTGEGWEAYGLPFWGWADRRTFRAWGRGLLVALLVCAIVFPLFFLVFVGYSHLIPFLPGGVTRFIAPYAAPLAPRVRMPGQLGLLLVNHLFVVALPEELFYRGFMQTRWQRAGPGRKLRVLGAVLGAGFLQTQVLFALGHLVVFEFWRLGTFFPGLLFGWLRARTGDITSSVFVHALSNVFLRVLEASFYG